MIFICLILPEIHPFPKTENSFDFKRFSKHLALFYVGGWNKKKSKNRPLAQLNTGDISEGKTVIFGSEVQYNRWQIPPEVNMRCYQ